MLIYLVAEAQTICTELHAILQDIHPEIRIMNKDSAEVTIEDVAECQPDLVMLDLGVKAGYWVNFLLDINKHLPATPVMALGSEVSRPYRECCQSLGAKWLYDKMYHADMIKKSVARLASSPVLA